MGHLSESVINFRNFQFLFDLSWSMVLQLIFPSGSLTHFYLLCAWRFTVLINRCFWMWRRWVLCVAWIRNVWQILSISFFEKSFDNPGRCSKTEYFDIPFSEGRENRRLISMRDLVNRVKCIRVLSSKWNIFPRGITKCQTLCYELILK